MLGSLRKLSNKGAGGRTRAETILRLWPKPGTDTVGNLSGRGAWKVLGNLSGRGAWRSSVQPGSASVAICTALLAAGLAVCAGAPAAFARSPRIAYVDGKDAYTSLPSLKECFKGLDVAAESLKPTDYLVPARQEILFIGSFLATGKEGGGFMKRNADRLRRFVEEGGVVVAMGQGADQEPSVAWLPGPLVAERSDRDCFDAEAPDRSHPLLTDPNPVSPADLMGLDVFKGKGYYGCSIGGGSDLFSRTRGFSTVVREKGGAGFPALIVGSAARGHVVLMSISPDRACVHGSTPEIRAAASAFMGNLVAYSRALQGGRAASLKPTPFDSAAKTHVARVFLDSDRDGKQDADEKGFPRAQLSYGFTPLAAGESGEARFQVDPGAPQVLWLHVPAGYEPTTRFFSPARLSGPHRFGLAPAEDAGSGPVSVVHLTDSHLGRNLDAGAEAALLAPFIQRLAASAPGDPLLAMTGDLTHTGDRDQVEALRKVVQGAATPVALVPGNHDLSRGPDSGRWWEEAIGPFHWTRDWHGFRLLGAPILTSSGDAGKWISRQVAEADRPLLIFLHYYPKRAEVDRLPAGKVAAIFSGHWHADSVTVRNGIVSVNTPTTLIGAWDFSPGSARVVTLERGRVVSAQLVPFAARTAHALITTRSGTLVASQTAGPGASLPRCSAGSDVLSPADSTPSSSLFRLGSGADAASAVVCSGDGWSQSAPTGGQAVPEWAAAVPGNVLMAGPVVHGKQVLVPFRSRFAEGHAGGIVALDTESGKRLWEQPSAAVTVTTPVVVGDRVVVADLAGNMAAYRAGTGEELWRSSVADAVAPRFLDHMVHASGVAHEGVVYHCYQAAPFGVSAASGKVMWVGKAFGSEDAFSHSRGVVTRGALLCAGLHGGLYRYRLDSSSGEGRRLVEKAHTSSDLRLSKGLWLTTRSRLQRLDPDTGVPEFTVTIPYAILPAEPAFGADFIVSPLGHKGVARFQTPSGARAWTYSPGEPLLSFALNELTSRGLIGSPVLAGARLFVPGTDGALHVLDARTGALVGRLELGVPLASTPAVSGDLLFVADYGGMLYRLDASRVPQASGTDCLRASGRTAPEMVRPGQLPGRLAEAR